jgi:hypothetical protein
MSANPKLKHKTSGLPPATRLLSSLSWCSGITRIGEEKSEIVFLLVENYNYIDAFVGFGRRGIFEWENPQQVLHFSLLVCV